MALADTVTFLPLSELHPDPSNPRLRHEQRGRLSDDQLLVFIDQNYEALIVAESVARHGFFGSEPLVVCQEDGRWIVLEGNRRLTALLGLARPGLRAQFDNAQLWNELAERRPIPLDMEVPVLVADERSDADALIGFRHISGVMDWKPLQRAQYIAYLVDERRQAFLEVADTVGLEEEIVRMLYRNQSIIEQARSLGRPDVADASERRFGTLTAALNRIGIREFIGARTANRVRERTTQLQPDKLDALADLASWMYGSDGREKVIQDTRNLTELAEVLREPAALEELYRSRDLSAAYALTPGPPKRLLRQLATAVGHLRSVANSADLCWSARPAPTNSLTSCPISLSASFPRPAPKTATTPTSDAADDAKRRRHRRPCRLGGAPRPHRRSRRRLHGAPRGAAPWRRQRPGRGGTRARSRRR